MNNDIVSYLKEHSEGVSSKELAELFLKFKNPQETIANAAIYGLLSKDRRCFQGENKLWYLHKDALSNTTENLLQKTKFTSVFFLRSVAEPEKVLYTALWEISETPTFVWGSWLSDPAQFPADEKELLLNDEVDIPFDKNARGDYYERICTEISNSVLILRSYNDFIFLSNICTMMGVCLTDDTILLSDLLQCSSYQIPGRFTLEKMFQIVLGSTHTPSNAFKQSLVYAECLSEIIRTMLASGIKTLDDIENSVNVGFDNTEYFKNKVFSENDILKQSSGPGVYGFKNKEGIYIYIGKSKNLRRRLMGYFKPTNESVQKIEKIRSDSYDMVTYRCGSELEALLYEYRLIKKHNPALNSKMEIQEQKGVFKPIDDCILILPHSQKEKLLSFWFRKEQKVMIRTLDAHWKNDEVLLNDMNVFFFSDKLLPDNQDFPELEIATRWVKKQTGGFEVIPVSRYGEVSEILIALKCVWNEFEKKSLKVPELEIK
jgi:hypothetical protein